MTVRKNIRIFWKLKGRWRPIFQESFGISRHHNILNMVVFHNFYRARMNLQSKKLGGQ
jgi:hypothetical protein